MRKLAVLLGAVLALTVFATVATANGGRGTQGNIVETLSRADNFTTLVSLVGQGGPRRSALG